MKEKLILDACCGTKMMWFHKDRKDVLFVDRRKGEYHATNGIIARVEPDFVADFTSLPFPDESFKLVVFDPPHRSDLTENNWMAQQYGKLFPTWETDIKAGFNECMRVLKPDGVLIFKWNEKQIKVKRILKLIEVTPLFGHTTARHTIWMTFMKTKIGDQVA